MTRSLLVSIFCVTAGCSSDPPCESSVGAPPPADARFATPDSVGTEGCEPGSLADFDATGFWYAEQDGVRVLDVSDPTHPVEVGHLAGLIYVADTPGGLLVARILE